jgi:DNA (cytosine-5)-methyltransferase 1
VTALYNENAPYPAAWLRNLVAAGLIAKGTVDDRTIEDLTPADVASHTQAHFFAGIGVWSLALRLAGWPDDVPVWTGSAPCQPFSGAGAKRGFDDERHLWPTWFALIDKCRPPIVFGEQVASPDGYEWFGHVRDDLERAGYAVGAHDFSAASCGAPHIRQRLYFTGVATDRRRELDPLRDFAPRSMGYAGGYGSGQYARELPSDEAKHGRRATQRDHAPIVAGATSGFWNGADWLYCRDGRWRPVEPGTFPLAHGHPTRVEQLRAYGNAIVAPQAAAFITAVMDSLID